MNRRELMRLTVQRHWLKIMLPLVLSGCAHFEFMYSQKPSSKTMKRIPQKAYGNAPSKQEVETGLISSIDGNKVYSINYSTPSVKVCWNDVSSYQTIGHLDCGWGVESIPLIVAHAAHRNPTVTLFKNGRVARPALSSTMEAAKNGFVAEPKTTRFLWFTWPDTSYFFIVAADTSTSLDWIPLVLNQTGLELQLRQEKEAAESDAEHARIAEEGRARYQADRALEELAEAAAKRKAERVEAAKIKAEERRVAKEAAILAAGAALCGKVGLDDLCYLNLAPVDFLRDFGGSFTQNDKAAFYNAWRLGTERQKQEIARQREEDESRRQSQEELKAKEESARQRNQVYQPVQVIYPDNSRQQQMTNFLLLNQIQRSFQPRTTNCTTVGSNTNCTGY